MRVLLALDLSEPVQDLLSDAASWAERLRAELHLAYTEPFGQVEQLVSDPRLRELLSEEAQQARQADIQRLQGLLEAVSPELRGDVHLLSGEPSRAILDLGASFDAIFLGTHGRKGLAHWALGSVAERVVRRATKPVVVLRPEGRAE